MVKKRNSLEDLWKFIAALLLMTRHLYHLRGSFIDGSYHWFMGWIFTDFFLLLTGYHTYKHFAKHDTKTLVKTSISYTLNKFKRFLPYTTILIVVQYLADSIYIYKTENIKAALTIFKDMPLEMIMLQELYKTSPRLVPIWFLSAMFLMLPVYIIIIHIKKKPVLLVLSLVYSISLYSYIGLETNYRNWPFDMPRVLAGLLLGAGVCIIVEYLESYFSTKSINQQVLLIVQNICFLSILIITFFNLSSLGGLVLGLMAIIVGILSSNWSLSFYNPVLSYLGNISMPLYICHWAVGTIILYVTHFIHVNSGIRVSAGTKAALYYIGSIILAILLYTIIETFRKKRQVKSLAK